MTSLEPRLLASGLEVALTQFELSRKEAKDPRSGDLLSYPATKPLSWPLSATVRGPDFRHLPRIRGRWAEGKMIVRVHEH